MCGCIDIVSCACLRKPEIHHRVLLQAPSTFLFCFFTQGLPLAWNLLSRLEWLFSKAPAILLFPSSQCEGKCEPLHLALGSSSDPACTALPLTTKALQPEHLLCAPLLTDSLLNQQKTYFSVMYSTVSYQFTPLNLRSPKVWSNQG